MKAYMHYLEERKDGKLDWYTVALGGLRKPGGPKLGPNAQVTLGKNHQHTLIPKYNRRYLEPRPAWAAGLVGLGVVGLGMAGMTASFALGASMFAAFGIAAIAAGAYSYQKTYHLYALFCEGVQPQLPFIRSFGLIKTLRELIETTDEDTALAAKARKADAILKTEIQWGFIIAAAAAGLGVGAVIGSLASHAGK